MGNDAWSGEVNTELECYDMTLMIRAQEPGGQLRRPHFKTATSWAKPVQDKRNSHEVLSSVADTALYTWSTPRSVMHL